MEQNVVQCSAVEERFEYHKPNDTRHRLKVMSFLWNIQLNISYQSYSSSYCKTSKFLYNEQRRSDPQWESVVDRIGTLALMVASLVLYL